MSNLQRLLDVLNESENNLTELTLVVDERSRLKLYKNEKGKFDDRILSLNIRHCEITNMFFKYGLEVHIKRFFSEVENMEAGEPE